jgi:hypothetical protein
MGVSIGPQGLFYWGTHRSSRALDGRAIRLGEARAFPKLEERRLGDAELGLYIFERVPNSMAKNRINSFFFEKILKISRLQRQWLSQILSHAHSYVAQQHKE